MISYETVDGFQSLFSGYPHAHGTGKGGWVHQPPQRSTYLQHLEGRGDGLGIGPLLPNDTCAFCAIDLDRPDFDLAKEMMKLLPGVSWLERSRSGNAHVLVFFKAPLEAWVARGIMRETLAALGERTVEVFPKTDHLLPGMVGNYLNLPYFGDARPVIGGHDNAGFIQTNGFEPLTLTYFVHDALAHRNDPEDWRKRARWLGVPSPEERRQNKSREFGTSSVLHVCAEHVIEHRDDNPVVEGHRAVVYFNLAKQLSNYSEFDHDEVLAMMALVNDSSPDPISSDELERILRNAERGQFTSTGCDDPLFLAYASPECPIAKEAM